MFSLYLYICIRIYLYIHIMRTLLSDKGGEGVGAELPTKFSKIEDLTGPQFLEGFAGGEGLQFLLKK